MSTRFGQDFEVVVQARFVAGIWPAFFRGYFVEVMNLNLGRDFEARFGQDLRCIFSIKHGYFSHRNIGLRRRGIN